MTDDRLGLAAVSLFAVLAASALVADGIGASANTRVGAGDSDPDRSADASRHRRVRVTVHPRVGFPRKHFRVRFRARNNARRSWFYDVEATGPEREGCDSDTSIFLHADRGDLVTLTVPRGTKPNWCIGRYEGLIFLFRENADGESVSEKVVGRFSFRVEQEE